MQKFVEVLQRGLAFVATETLRDFLEPIDVNALVLPKWDFDVERQTSLTGRASQIVCAMYRPGNCV